MKHKNECVALLHNLFCLIKLSFGNKLNVLKVITQTNCERDVSCKFLIIMAFHIKRIVLTPLSKLVFLSGSINIFSKPLHHSSNLPHSFWGKCVLCATYIINRFPISRLGNISPYEKLFGTSPYTNHLKIFGCLCYISTLKKGRSKFHSRADPCIFLGYPYG